MIASRRNFDLFLILYRLQYNSIASSSLVLKSNSFLCILFNLSVLNPGRLVILYLNFLFIGAKELNVIELESL